MHRDGAIYYLIFCRSVWHYPLRLDNPLYIEVVFNQIAPDYLEGLLLVMPGEQIDQEVVYDIAKVAALLHRAADMDHKPTIKETKFLLPKPALSARDIKPPQWVNMVSCTLDNTFHVFYCFFFLFRYKAAGKKFKNYLPAKPRHKFWRSYRSGLSLDQASLL